MRRRLRWPAEQTACRPACGRGRSQRVGQGVAVLQLLPPRFHLPQLGGGGVNDQLGVFSIHHCAAARRSSGYPLPNWNTAGMPMLRAIMAAWLVSLSVSEASPRIMPGA